MTVYPDSITDGLDDAQRHAVFVDATPLAIIAAAGSGKTRVLTRRIMRRALDGSADLNHTLAITFTRKAAGELTRRLGATGLRDRATVGTFHAIAWSVLRQRAADQGRQPPQLLTSRASLVREILAPRYQDVNDVVGGIDWARARRISPAEYEASARRAGRSGRLPAGQIAEHYEAYEQRKNTKRLLDFDDLLEHLVRDIERDRSFADVQRWRFRHLYVDEFQDINPLQLRLLHAWRGDRTDLCVVGDPSQAIYGWNGADPEVLRSIDTHLPGVTVVRLETNHRSTPQIVDTSVRILGGAGSPTGASRADGPRPLVIEIADEVAEGPRVVELLDRYRAPGRRWSSCAVLARTNAQLASIEVALAEAGVPTRRRAGRALFGQPVVRRALTDDHVHLSDWLADLQTRLNDRWYESGDELTNIRPDAGEENEALRSVVARGYEHLDAQPSATVGSFRLAMTQPEEFGFDGVDLLSFHAAKGLEWDTVVLVGIESGYVPHSGATSRDALDEETRLFYVAVTRATRQLIVTHCVRRGTQRRRASPLLQAFDREVETVAPPPSDLALRRRAPVAVDQHTAALDGWRRTLAKSSRVSPEVVLSDAALAAIVREKPDSEAALASVEGVGILIARRFGGAILDCLK